MTETTRKKETAKQPQINGARLKRLLDGVNSFGRNPETGGWNRVGYSDADMQVRRWFEAQLASDGLSVSRDGVANLFGRFGPDHGPCIMIGSHLDTVPEGGAYDGALGACVALECVRALQDACIEPQIAIEVVATAEEEGRFGGMLGSQAIAGKVTRKWIEQARDAHGTRLVDAMAAHGLDAFGALACAREPGSVAAFLELHVEQGPVLENTGLGIGIADTVSGITNISMRLQGVANHSGTTPMNMRADALNGLADIVTAIPEVIDAHGGPQTRITIGKVALSPNHPHTIPGLAEFSLVVRDVDEARQHKLVDAMIARAEQAATRQSLTLSHEQRSWLSPVKLDDRLVKLSALLAQEHDLSHMVMPSGAGHDAQTMQSLCPSALIFVPSRNGISHAPDEYTAWPDIEKGAELMLALVTRLASDGMPS